VVRTQGEVTRRYFSTLSALTAESSRLKALGWAQGRRRDSDSATAGEHLRLWRLIAEREWRRFMREGDRVPRTEARDPRTQHPNAPV